MNPKALSTGKIVLLVVLGVLVVAALWVWSTYNALVSLNENAKTAQADIEVQYQRRFDLIPNLVSAVEGIMEQEREVFAQLAEARTRYAGTQAGSSDRVGAINQVEGSLARLLVVMENYPQLRSNETVQAQIAELSGTENRIAVARERYNEAVRDLNQQVRSFPTNLMAGIFGFDQKEPFAAATGAEKAPVVDMNLNK